MKISVITVAYINGEIVLDLLNSIEQYNDLGDDLEVIVVDNSPEDQRIEHILEQSHYRNYQYIASDNKGFGAGNNLGAERATGEILAFINPDVVLIEPIFNAVYQHFISDSQLALMGIRLVYEDLSPGFSFYLFDSASIVKKQLQTKWNRSGKFIEDRMYIAGADLFVRRSMFEAAGCFDENIFMYYEEPDLIRRLKKAFPKCRIGFDSGLKMIHLESKAAVPSLLNLGREVDSAIYYGNKYGLDVKKKLRFEYRYMCIKQHIYSLFNREKSTLLKEQCDYLTEHYSDYLK